MANDYFQFRQFTVYQQHAAMKVCTDACVFGAWVAAHAAGEATRILDIGTGTGLLSLMMAQQSDAQIDAVDIDDAAARQAADNVQASPWSSRVHVHVSSLQVFDKAVLYDLVVSNPPFYENELPSADARRNIALHSGQLTLSELASHARRLLEPERGRFAVLLPFQRCDAFIALMKAQAMHLERRLLVKQTPAHGWFRGMLLFSAREKEFVAEEISIRDASGGYSEGFTRLLRGYYLHL